MNFQPMAMNASTIATLMNTMMVFTSADSCVPRMSSSVNTSRMISAGAFSNPWCRTPEASVKLSKGE